MNSYVDRALTVAAVVAALGIATAAVRREFFSPKPETEKTTIHADWGEWRSSARLVGDSTALLTVTVFSDIECPFCAKFHERIISIVRARPSEVALQFVHFPLGNRPRARTGAIAADCAAEQGRFEEMLLVLFSRPRGEEATDSAATKILDRLLGEAKRAGVADLKRFEQCIGDPDAAILVDAGLRLGTKLGVNATPTWFINGVRYRSNPSDSLFTSIADTARRGGRRGVPR